MAHTNTTTAIKTLLASALFASGIGALTPGGVGAAIETPTQTSTTSPAPARQESTPQIEADGELEILITETTIHTETREQQDRATWAINRFAEAGLQLPPVEINLHSDKAECGGNNGSLTDLNGAGYVIHSCGNEFTLLHELAHAWDMHTLDDETKDEFLAKAAQATTWNNSENWYLAGGEHAANTIAWGLLEERINQTRTRPYDTTSMLEGFEILTGSEPLWLDA